MTHGIFSVFFPELQTCMQKMSALRSVVHHPPRAAHEFPFSISFFLSSSVLGEISNNSWTLPQAQVFKYNKRSMNLDRIINK
jgi:hypothetical protein